MDETSELIMFIRSSNVMIALDPLFLLFQEQVRNHMGFNSSENMYFKCSVKKYHLERTFIS